MSFNPGFLNNFLLTATALGAAFLAAEDGGYITTEHIIRATKREYQKVGKLCTEGDFAQYFELVKG